MKKDLCPSVDSLLKVDYKKPYHNWLDMKFVILLFLAIASLICVFLPWMNVGVALGDNSLKLRAFGFTTTCGIIGLITSLVAVAATLYRQFTLTFCASLVALFIGILAVNTYPDCKVVVGYSDKATQEFVESELASKGISPDAQLKVPGAFVAMASMATEFADQDLFKFIAKETPKLRYIPFDHLDFTNNRWGAVLFLIFSMLTTLFSYAVIKHGEKFLNGKPASSPNTEEATECAQE